MICILTYELAKKTAFANIIVLQIYIMYSSLPYSMGNIHTSSRR